jgi:hypothetical protein
VCVCVCTRTNTGSAPNTYSRRARLAKLARQALDFGAWRVARHAGRAIPLGRLHLRQHTSVYVRIYQDVSACISRRLRLRPAQLRVIFFGFYCFCLHSMFLLSAGSGTLRYFTSVRRVCALKVLVYAPLRYWCILHIRCMSCDARSISVWQKKHRIRERKHVQEACCSALHTLNMSAGDWSAEEEDVVAAAMEAEVLGGCSPEGTAV